MRSVYIAGKYSDKDEAGEDKNIMLAAAVAAEYLKDGWAVFCPHTMTQIIDRKFNRPRQLKWEDWLAADIHWISKCDAIHMLPNWRESEGAKVEYLVAKGLGLEIQETMLWKYGDKYDGKQ